jgi:hypothetical protein
MTTSLAFLGLPEIFMLLVFFPISLALFGFWVWMLIHAIQNRGLNDSERIVWVIVIVFVNLLGAIIYFFVGRPKANEAAFLPPRGT